MKLLLLTPQLPYPPRQGTAIRNWGLIKHLARRHTLTLLGFQDTPEAPAPELAAACAQVSAVAAPVRSRADRLRTLLAGQADLARRLWSPALAAELTRHLAAERFDIVQIEGLEMAPYGLRELPAGTRLVYDAHNVEYLLQRRACFTDLRRPARWPAAAYSALQWPRLRRLEARVCRAAAAVTCVSAEDGQRLQALGPRRPPVLVPNGIDVDDYQPPAGRAAGPPAVVFTGKMDYRPNVDAVLWFLAEVWPQVRASRPEARCLIVGQRPTPPVRAWDGQAGCTVTGAVDDARPYIAGADVYVAPLRLGGGTRFKLLEAMALERPIVSTTLGAEGFPVTDGRELLIADAPGAFAQAILRVLADQDLARRLGAAGRAFVRAGYDWSVIIPALEAVYAAG